MKVPKKADKSLERERVSYFNNARRIVDYIGI